MAVEGGECFVVRVGRGGWRGEEREDEAKERERHREGERQWKHVIKTLPTTPLLLASLVAVVAASSRPRGGWRASEAWRLGRARRS